MELDFSSASAWLLGPEPIDDTHPGHLWPRWIVLRCLGLIYFSAFYSLLFQIQGLIGPNGILPAADYLKAVGAAFPDQKFWFAPTLFWFGASDRALIAVCWLGVIASILLALNLWPRASLAICFACFLSFVCAAQDFSNYQSDGMLLEAGFIALFLSPPGFLPGLGRANAPSRISLFLLQWEWFRIYFESGVAKMASGDVAWRKLTAMDDYYQNGPLPTWIGWYVQQLPHWFHASAVVYTLADRARIRLDAVSSSELPHSVLLHRDAIRSVHHPYRQLHVLELSRPPYRLPLARRPRDRMDRPAKYSRPRGSNHLMVIWQGSCAR